MPTRRAVERKSYLEQQQETAKWRLENLCQQWNVAFPVGTKVRYLSIACHEANFTDTKTRSEAWIMGKDQLVVMLEGVSGCVACDHLRIRIEAPLVTPVPDSRGTS